MPKHIGLDLGTSNVRMYIKGRGIVLRSPTVVAVDKNEDRVVALGSRAKQMIGKTPAHITAFKPIKNGVIAESGNHDELLAHKGEYYELYQNQFAGIST